MCFIKNQRFLVANDSQIHYRDGMHPHAPAADSSLSELPRNIPARIAHIEASPELTARLYALGMVEGARVRVTKRAGIFSGLLAIEVAGRTIALRSSQAQMIRVTADELCHG